MKKFLLLLLLTTVSANAQVFRHASADLRQGNDVSFSIVPDVSGNIYSYGLYNATPTSTGTTGSVLIKKMNADMSLLWTKNFPGKVLAAESGVDSKGNFYITGTYFDSLKFSDDLILRATQFEGKIFLAKFDQSGELKWVKSIFGTKDYGNHASGLVLDKSDNVYVSGQSDMKIFFAKFDSEGNELLRKYAESQTHSNASGIDIDRDGNVYIAGYFLGWASFDDIQVSQTYGLFLAKYNSAGAVQWAKAYGDAATAVLDVKIKLDKEKNIFWSASLMGDLKLDETVIKPANFMMDFFIAKHDSNGKFLWGNHLPTPAGISAVSLGSGNYLSVDNFGNAYLGASFRGKISFSSEAVIEAQPQHFEAMLVKYSPVGDVVWARATASAGNTNQGRENIFHSVVYHDGKVFVAGSFYSDSLMLGEYSFGNTEKFSSEAFSAVLEEEISAIDENPVRENFLSPNPAIDILKFRSENIGSHLEIYDITGRKIWGCEITSSVLGLPALLPGTYMAKLISNKISFERLIVLPK